MTIKALCALRDNSESDEQRHRIETVIQGQEQLLTSLNATEFKGITAALDINWPHRTARGRGDMAPEPSVTNRR
ncbi:hypothetical protein [Mycobacterium sp.]|uniref:hypothetical protein n=1 Tax=Mycobacterium sp. TaxID=1785 RepID=UPI003F99B67C